MSRSMRLESVQVVADLDDFGAPFAMGHLARHRSRLGEVLSFAYAPEWLQRPAAFAFDPDLTLVTGTQYPAAGHVSFGIFTDSSPDRWGRVLMQRRENLLARREERRPRALTAWDFLLGVHDETRLGALRFRSDTATPFIDHDEQLAAPPITSLGVLHAASLNFERHLDDEQHPDYVAWLAQLFAPGTSLGGARPKATVRDESGALCLAKFPSHNDDRDVGAWELVANRLAAAAGINVPESRAIRLPRTAYTTFLAKRFDRTRAGGRVAFVSAMTLTQHSDGDSGASYLELVDLLQSRGTDTRLDCAELFRRVLFNILIHNTDDHLRNHGFFLNARGARLSPAFDLNPSIHRQELSLAINEIETACDVSIAMDAARNFGLTPAAASAILDQVQSAVSGWRDLADYFGIPRAEQSMMSVAFERLR